MKVSVPPFTFNPDIKIPDQSGIQKSAPDVSSLWTIEQVSQHLQLSRATIFVRISAGHLKPIKLKAGKKNGQRGVGGKTKLFFNPVEVEQLAEKLKQERMFKMTPGPTPQNRPKAVTERPAEAAPSRPTKKDYSGYTPEDIGKISATATELFDAGKNVRNIVVELKVSYEIATHLYEQWKACGPEWHLPSRQYALLRNRFSWDEDVPTPEGFIRAVQGYIDAEIRRRLGSSSPDNNPTPAAA